MHARVNRAMLRGTSSHRAHFGRSEDAAGIAWALGDIARAKGMSQVPRSSGLSRESLYKSLSEQGNPSLATVLKVAKALGLRLHAEAA